MAAIGTWLASLAGPIVTRALASLGVGVVSYAAITTLLNQALNAAKASWSGLPGEVLSLLQIAGVPDFFSIIAGGLVAVASLQVVKRLRLVR